MWSTDVEKAHIGLMVKGIMGGFIYPAGKLKKLFCNNLYCFQPINHLWDSRDSKMTFLCKIVFGTLKIIFLWASTLAAPEADLYWFLSHLWQTRNLNVSKVFKFTNCPYRGANWKYPFLKALYFFWQKQVSKKKKKVTKVFLQKQFVVVKK